jgi:hypothetical protein
MLPKQLFRHRAAIAIIVIGMMLGACGPEADRSRGDGASSGADFSDPVATIDIVGDMRRDRRIEYNFPARP